MHVLYDILYDIGFLYQAQGARLRALWVRGGGRLRGARLPERRLRVGARRGLCHDQRNRLHRLACAKGMPQQGESTNYQGVYQIMTTGFCLSTTLTY